MTALQNAAVNRSGRMNPVKIQPRTECAALAQCQKTRPVLHRKMSQEPAQAGIERQNASIPEIQRERAIQIRAFEQARLALPAQAARQNASAAVHGIWQAQTGQQCARVVKPQTEIQSDLVCLICATRCIWRIRRACAPISM